MLKKSGTLEKGQEGMEKDTQRVSFECSLTPFHPHNTYKKIVPCGSSICMVTP